MNEKKLLKSIEEILDRKLEEKLDEKLKGFASKDDLKAFATKEDLNAFATKEDWLELKNEVNRLKASIDKCVTTERFEQFINDMFVPLNGKVYELKPST